MVHFKQLLENRPDYWVAMARLIEVMRRTGNLEKIPEYLTKSEDFVGTRASLEPGLNFCKVEQNWLRSFLKNSSQLLAFSQG